MYVCTDQLKVHGLEHVPGDIMLCEGLLIVTHYILSTEL